MIIKKLKNLKKQKTKKKSNATTLNYVSGPKSGIIKAAEGFFYCIFL